MNKHEEELLDHLVSRLGDQYQLALSVVRTELAQSVNGVLLKGAQYVPLPAAGIVAGQLGDLMLARSPGCIVGLGLREVGGTSRVAVTLHDGYSAADPIVGSFNMTANASATGPLSSNPGGVFFSTGLFMEVTGPGTLGGGFYLKGVD